jgi:hypothetical protein
MIEETVHVQRPGGNVASIILGEWRGRVSGQLSGCSARLVGYMLQRSPAMSEEEIGASLQSQKAIEDLDERLV